MIDPRSRLGRAGPVLIASAAMLAVACFRREAPVPPAPKPTTPEVIVPASIAPPAAGLPVTALPETSEPYIDMRMVDAPVRLVLEQIAKIANIDLIIPANINKTISVQYVHVPASVALKDVLTRSGLRLGTGTTGQLPFDTVTVFYRLPANIDSMSSDAIMRRFGVSRAMADMIIKARTPP